MDHVEIPATATLEAMLRKLCLPTLNTRPKLLVMAATMGQAIWYLEAVEKKVPKESQHSVLEKEKNINRGLLRKLKSVNQKMIKKDKQLKEIMDASDTYIEKVCACTDCIQKIGSNSSPPCCNSGALLEIKAVAIDLAQHSVEIIQKFKATKLYPYGEDGADSSECYDSDVVHLMSDAYEFDSDSRLYDSDDYAVEYCICCQLCVLNHRQFCCELRYLSSKCLSVVG